MRARISPSPSRSGAGPVSSSSTSALSADLVATLTQRNVEKALGGTFPGEENRFFPRSIELGFFGQIDPYARGVVRIEVSEETDNGGHDFKVDVPEAHLTLLTLPWSTQLKMGRMLNRFGMLNQIHEDDLPQDRPAQRAHALLRARRADRERRGADLGGAAALLSRGPARHLQWGQRDRVRASQPPGAPRHHADPDLLRDRRRQRDTGRRVRGHRRDPGEAPEHARRRRPQVQAPPGGLAAIPC
jgi:hypothetical protein